MEGGEGHQKDSQSVKYCCRKAEEVVLGLEKLLLYLSDITKLCHVRSAGELSAPSLEKGNTPKSSVCPGLYFNAYFKA